jgi:hypothetical protein
MPKESGLLVDSRRLNIEILRCADGAEWEFSHIASSEDPASSVIENWHMPCGKMIRLKFCPINFAVCRSATNNAEVGKRGLAEHHEVSRPSEVASFNSSDSQLEVRFSQENSPSDSWQPDRPLRSGERDTSAASARRASHTISRLSLRTSAVSETTALAPFDLSRP